MMWTIVGASVRSSQIREGKQGRGVRSAGSPQFFPAHLGYVCVQERWGAPLSLERGRNERERKGRWVMELLLTMPADMRSPKIVRGALGVLVPLFPSAFVDDVRLLTNELVTNVIKHGGLERSDELEIHAESWPERVRVEVVGGTRPIHLRPTGAIPYQTSGWGLLLVGALSNRWGYRDEGETAVWFEIDRARRVATDPLPPEVTPSQVDWRSLRRRRRQSRAS